MPPPLGELRDVRARAARPGSRAASRAAAARTSAALGGGARRRQPGQVDERVARARHALVQLDDHARSSPAAGPACPRARRRPRRGVCRSSTPSGCGTPSSANSRRQPVLEPSRPSRGSAPYIGMPRRQRDVPLELGRVVGDQVRSAPVRGSSAAIWRSSRGRSSSFSLSGRGDESPTGTRCSRARAWLGITPGQQGEVVLDDRRVDRHRGHVDHPQPRLAQQQEQEQEPLL